MKNFKIPFEEPFKKFLPLKQYFIQNRWPLALGLASLLVVDFLQLLIPLVIKKAIDLLTTGTVPSHALLKQGGVILGIALMIVFFRYMWRLLIFGHARRVEQGLRNRLYQHLQTLSLSYYHKTKTGDIMARATNDINAIRMAAGMGLVALTDGVVLGMAAIGFMMSINVKLTLISLIPAPMVIILSRVFTRRMSSGFEAVQKSFSDLTERVREAFAGIRVIKAYNRDAWEYERVKEKGAQYISVNMGLAKTLALFFPMMAIFTNVGLAVVIWMGGRLTILGDITMGDFVAFTGYLNLLTWPMMAMGWVTSLIQRASASMGRINRVLEEVPEITDSNTARPAHRVMGGIEFTGLTIRYPGKTDDALADIHYKIEAGETVAVAGGVGSGKTTLLHAIPRLLEVPPGTLFIDGHDIREISLNTLRESIGFVTQEPFIFSDTVRNNVLFGMSGVSQKDLEAVLQAASISEEILAMENGLDTILGERGVTLSGGQRQRLTIARALILSPSILILDDALSMVDTRTEETILNNIMKQRRNKTNLIFSHRVSTIARADRIVVLDQGKLVEQGSYNELIEQGRVYARLYKRQQLAQELGD
jgi:ATP-binding cassette subfamily B multidrug efflux pump